MYRAFRKDVVREIKNTFGRFLAIFAIVFLGVAFYTGIGTTGLNMKATGDQYFAEKNLMDIRVLSTYGINDNDIKAISSVEGVEAVYPSYNMDALVQNDDAQIVVKIHSLGSADAINGLTVASGRMPLAANEAVAERGFARALGLELGDYFILESGKKTDLRDSLKNVRFRLVGITHASYYVSNAERGPSSIGSGAAHYYMYIPESNFRRNVYNEAFVTVGGARGIPCYGTEYEDLIDGVADRLEAVGDIRVGERYIEVTSDAYMSLEAAETELEASRVAAVGEFERLHDEIGAARQSLEAARRGLGVRQGGVYAGMRELDMARDSVRGGIAALGDAAGAAQARERELSRISFTIVEAIASLDREAAGLVEMEALAGAAFMDDPQSHAAYMDGISGARSAIAATRSALQGDLEAALAGEAAARGAGYGAADMRASLEAQLAELSRQADVLADGEIEISGGYVEINRGIDELNRQYTLLLDQEADAYRQMDESLMRIKSARKALDDMDKPKWYVMDRDSNPGYSGFFGDAEKVEAIGRVFPFLFYVVAALVSLTTMTRLVEERRIEIGTLKSLGYGDYKIMSKYIIYATVPTVLGGIFGGYVGMQFFPAIIISAYQSLYAIPDPVAALNADFWLLGTAIGSVSTLGATVAACSHELRARPSILMRSKAPKRGARIFLERVPLVWSSLTFIWKVTIRNIVRYKKRFFMTITGIAGCTALLMTGFGLRDSIETMIFLQYGGVNLYDITVSFTDTAKTSELDSVEALLQNSEIVSGVMPFRQKIYDSGSYGGGKSAISVNLVVPSEVATFHSFVNLRDRLTHARVSIAESGVVVTEKLASQLGVGRGDVFYIEVDGERLDMTVADITENYYMHYIFMHESMYMELFGEAPEYNAMYALFGSHTEDQKH